jgi:transposase
MGWTAPAPGIDVPKVVVGETPQRGEPSAMPIITIGLDLAKHWFQVHGVDATGQVVVRRRLRRSDVLGYFQSLAPCLVGIEACATAHHWARELTRLGHQVKLMPPAYVKAYVKRNKNDAADAEAICEAVTRPSMRFVPAKDADQQSVLMLHRARNLLVRQRTMLVNALRAHMAEFGIIAPQGLHHVEVLTVAIAHEEERLPALARSILQMLVDQLHDTMARIREIELRLTKWHRQSRVSQLLATVPGVGIMGASAIAATVTDPSLFRSGREFAAWLGMTPRQNSSGGKERLGRTSKRGDKYIRSLLIAGSVAVLRHTRNRTTKDAAWVRGLLERKPAKVAAVALANKTARIVWAVMARGECYSAKELLGQAA